MRRILKWIGLILGAVAGLVGIALVGLYIASTLRLNKTYQVQPA